MQSGIYDARGRLIEAEMVHEDEPQMPASIEEPITGRLIDNLAGSVFSQGNFRGNIIIRDRDGRKTIEILRDGTIIMYDRTHPRLLLGKQIGGF